MTKNIQYFPFKSSKWNSLSDGEHEITVVSKGYGFQNSIKSNSFSIVTSSPIADPYMVISNENLSNIPQNTVPLSVNDVGILEGISGIDSTLVDVFKNYQNLTIIEMYDKLYEYKEGSSYSPYDESEEGFTPNKTNKGNNVYLSTVSRISPASAFVFYNKETKTYNVDFDGTAQAYIYSPELSGRELDSHIAICYIDLKTDTMKFLEFDSIYQSDVWSFTFEGSGIFFLVEIKDPIIETGIYTWIQNPILTNINQSIDFTSNSQNYNLLDISMDNNGQISYSSEEDPDYTVVYSDTSWKNDSYKTITLQDGQSVSPDFYNWAISQKNLIKEVAESEKYITFTGDSSEFTLKATNKTWDGTLEWSTDRINWTVLNGTEEMQSVDKKLYLRGKGNTRFFSPFNSSDSKGVGWQLDEKAGCSGNIQTLLDWELLSTSISEAYCYRGMFYHCTSLTSAPELPATTLSSSCYMGMFNGCTSLTSAPELPATTLKNYCYYNIFNGCTSLTTAPELPATTLAEGCYRSMFSGCTSLTSTPELPATTLAESCYYFMFSGCTSLTSTPELPATTLSAQCYGDMFFGCTSLTTTPELPATILKNYCYQYMFYGCTSVTTTPELPATTLAAYCYFNMFSGCTSLTSTPELPATTLTEGCYQSMFNGCTSLTTTPELPATTLAKLCYRHMFYKCTSLKISETETSEYSIPWSIPSSGTITNTDNLTNWNTSMFEKTGGTFTGNPEINTTYYLHN